MKKRKAHLTSSSTALCVEAWHGPRDLAGQSLHCECGIADSHQWFHASPAQQSAYNGLGRQFRLLGLGLMVLGCSGP